MPREMTPEDRKLYDETDDPALKKLIEKFGVASLGDNHDSEMTPERQAMLERGRVQMTIPDWAKKYLKKNSIGVTPPWRHERSIHHPVHQGPSLGRESASSQQARAVRGRWRPGWSGRR